MKKLLGGLLLVSAISSWGLQAAQDATEQCFKDPVTVSFKRINNDGQEEFFSQTYVIERSVLEKSPMIRAMLYYDHQPLAGTTLPENAPVSVCEELSLVLVTGNPTIFHALFTVLAGNEDVSIKDWDTCIAGWSIKDVIEAYALIDYFFPFTDGCDTKETLTDYGNIQEARYVLGEKILVYTYNLSSEQQQIRFIYNEIIPAIGSFEQLLYACIEYTMTPVEGVTKDTKYLKEQLGLPVDQPLFLLISAMSAKKDAKGLQLLIEESILKKVVIPDYLQDNVLLKVIQKIVFPQIVFPHDERGPRNKADTLEIEDAQRSLVEAIKHNDTAIVKVLLAIYGRVLASAIDHEKTVGSQDHFHDRSVLLLAIERGNKDIVKLLLQAGADVDELTEIQFENTANSSSIFHGTPLGYAVWKGRTDIVNMLINAGANVSRDTLLYYAIRKKHNDIVKILLDAGAPMHLNALEQAIEAENKEVLKMLLDHGANVNIQDQHGVTPLMKAVAENNREMVQVLLQVPGIDLNLSGTIEVWFPRHEMLEGVTAFSLAEYLNYAPLVLDMAKATVAKNLRDGLIEAVSADVLDFDNIKMLLAYGADMYAVNDSGVSAFSVAEGLNNPDLEGVLAPYKKPAADNAIVGNNASVSGDAADNSMFGRAKRWWQSK